jgi:penicillin-binding protein 1A
VLKDAVVATEDKRFYSHFGVDPQGIASAVKINLTQGRGALQGHGGSTITQQLAKLLCLGEGFDPIKWKSESDYEAECRKSSIWRKVKEVPYAMAMEAKYSKQDILNIYMNRSYLGAGAGGVAALFRQVGGGCHGLRGCDAGGAAEGTQLFRAHLEPATRAGTCQRHSGADA